MHIDAHVLIVGLIVFVFLLAYCTTLFVILQKTPKEKRVFPAWFVWFFLIPVIGFVFQWMMIPFGIPFTLRNTFDHNQDAIRFTKWLTYIGLIQVLFPTFGLFFKEGIVSDIFAAGGIFMWAAYWIMILIFRSKYIVTMDSKNLVTTETR